MIDAIRNGFYVWYSVAMAKLAIFGVVVLIVLTLAVLFQVAAMIDDKILKARRK